MLFTSKKRNSIDLFIVKGVLNLALFHQSVIELLPVPEAITGFNH